MEEQTRSLSEVAGLMGVSERTVRRWIKSGRLKAYKPGRDYRIPETGLRQFIEESEVSPKAQASPSLEPSFYDVLEEERRVPLNYLKAWPRYIDRRAATFERDLEGVPVLPPLEDMPTIMPRVSEMYDELTSLVSAVDEMLASVRRPLEQVSEDEKHELRELGKAMDRLVALERRMNTIIEAAWARKEEAEAQERQRREHEEKQARTKRSLTAIRGELSA